MFRIQVDGLNPRVIERETLTSGSVNHHIVLLSFDSEWDELIKKAMFYLDSCDESYSVPIDEQNRAIVPNTLLRHSNEGKIIHFGVRGSTSDDELVLASKWVSIGMIQPGAHLIIEPPDEPPDPDWYTKILDEIEKSRDHTLLKNRDSKSQHPIDAISGFIEVPNYEILEIWKAGMSDG